MFKKFGSITVAAAVILSAVIPATTASADPGRSVRSGNGNSARGNSDFSRGSSRGSSNRVSRGDYDLGDALRGSGKDYGYGNGFGNGAIANALRDGYYQRERHNAHEEIADSYRDAAIGSAAIGALGMIISSAIAADRPVVAAPVVACPAPAPAGRWVQEKVLVKEGYYTYDRVWVAEYQDPATGVIIEGHYEQHKQWVPPVYELRDVWVPAR